MRKITIVLLLSLLTACGTPGESDENYLDSLLASFDDSAGNGPHAAGTSGFAQLRNISFSEAEVRLRRHSIAAKSGEYLEERGSNLFGGLWITEDDRIQIGIARYSSNGRQCRLLNRFMRGRHRIPGIRWFFT